MKSIFTDKAKEPDDKELKKALGATYEFWKLIRTFVKKADPGWLYRRVEIFE